MQNVDLVFVLGMPGAAKDTQIDRFVSQDETASKIYPGDMLRSALNKSQPDNPFFVNFNDLVEPYRTDVDSGNYVPGSVMLPLVLLATEQRVAEGKTTIFFSGYPNTLSLLYESADLLREKLKNDSITTRSLFLLLDVTASTSLERALQRSTKETEGRKRVDDSREIIERRIRNFEMNTKPVIDELERRDDLGLSVFEKIDGNGTQDQVFAAFEKAVKHFTTH